VELIQTIEMPLLGHTRHFMAWRGTSSDGVGAHRTHSRRGDQTPPCIRHPASTESKRISGRAAAEKAGVMNASTSDSSFVRTKNKGDRKGHPTV
jgi:hypothetical protein